VDVPSPLLLPPFPRRSCSGSLSFFQECLLHHDQRLIYLFLLPFSFSEIGEGLLPPPFWYRGGHPSFQTLPTHALLPRFEFDHPLIKGTLAAGRFFFPGLFTSSPLLPPFFRKVTSFFPARQCGACLSSGAPSVTRPLSGEAKSVIDFLFHHPFFRASREVLPSISEGGNASLLFFLSRRNF